MSFPLCVFTPLLGAASETFIQRHALELYPQGTSIIYVSKHHQLFWDTDQPKLSLEEKLPLKDRIYNKLYQTCSFEDKRSVMDPIHTNKVKDFLLENNTRVILGEYLDQSLWLLKIAQALQIKFYAHAHGYDVSSKLRDSFWRREYLKYNQADGIITMNQVTKQSLIKLGLQEDLVHVIPYGVEETGFLKDHSQSKKQIKCLAVGRMVEKKAPLKLLDAFHKAIKISPNLHLDYIGSGDLLPQVEKFIASQELQEHVTLHYERPNTFVKDKMKETDIFLQHSITDPYTGDQEGTPVAILEAMSFSLPVIATNHGGIPEAVENGVNGFLVEEGDTDSMAKCIIKLANDRNYIETLGKASKIRFLESFSWDVEKRLLKKLLKLD